MDRKKLVKLISVVLVFFIVLSLIGMITAREKNSLNFIERTVRRVSYPFQLFLSQVSDRAQLIFVDFGEISRLREENVELRKEISQYRYLIDDLKKDRQENQRLKDLLGFKEQTDQNFDLTVARIIGKSSHNWQRSLFINAGRRDGIEENMVVINHQGLIGKIINVSANASEVLLILDSDSGVGGRLLENRKTVGVVQGQGVDHNNLALVHMPKEMDISQGDHVITSGLDAIYPAELNIGIVTEIIETQRGFTKTAVLEPVVEFESLEEVFVITNYKKALLQDEIEEEEME